MVSSPENGKYCTIVRLRGKHWNQEKRVFLPEVFSHKQSRVHVGTHPVTRVFNLVN